MTKTVIGIVIVARKIFIATHIKYTKLIISYEARYYFNCW